LEWTRALRLRLRGVKKETEKTKVAEVARNLAIMSDRESKLDGESPLGSSANLVNRAAQ
jgi:hypothetical protein